VEVVNYLFLWCSTAIGWLLVHTDRRTSDATPSCFPQQDASQGHQQLQPSPQLQASIVHLTNKPQTGDTTNTKIKPSHTCRMQCMHLLSLYRSQQLTLLVHHLIPPHHPTANSSLSGTPAAAAAPSSQSSQSYQHLTTAAELNRPHQPNGAQT